MSSSSSAQFADAEKSEEECTGTTSTATSSPGTRKRKDTATTATEDTTPPKQRFCRRSPRMIPEEEINENDVICGRRSDMLATNMKKNTAGDYVVLEDRFNNTTYAGNTRFRTLLAAVDPDYCHPHTTTNQKIRLVTTIVQDIREKRTPPGRFLYQTSSEEEKEGAPNLDENNPKHRLLPPQFEVLGKFCSIQITQNELHNFGGTTTIETTPSSKQTTPTPAKTKKRQKKQPAAPNTTASSLNSQNKETAPVTKKNKASSDDDDDDDDKFYDPISSLDNAEAEEEEDDDDADTTSAKKNTTTTPASAAASLKDSRWKSIQSTVVQKIKAKLKSGTPFPKLPMTGVSCIVNKGTNPSYQVRLYFETQKRYLGSWKRPEIAAQARWYAIELINEDENENDEDKPALKDSWWKSIQGTVVQKIKAQLKSGAPFPKLPMTGVCKTKYNKYKVRIHFEKQPLYLGCWERPEIAAQARWYAKELIKNDNDNDDDDDGDDLNEEVKQELDRIRTVVKAKMKMKTDLDCTGNIALNQDSGNDGSVAMSSLQVLTTKKTSKQPEVKGYYKRKSGNYTVRVHFLGKQKHIGGFKSESEAALAYKIAMNEILQSPVLQLLTTLKTAKDKEWELIHTEIRRIIETATPNEIKEMLAILPKLKSKGYSKTTNGTFETKLWFGKKSRYIGKFADESKAELAFSLAYHKKINYIPSSNSATTAVVSEIPSSTPISVESPPPQMLSPTEEVSPQSTSPAVAAVVAAAKRDIGVSISSSTATTSNKRQKLNNINDDNDHHDDISPNDNEAGVEEVNTVPPAEPKKGTSARLKAFFLVITTASSKEGHDRLREEVVAINNTNRRRLTNPIKKIAVTSPVPSVLTTTTAATLSASSSIFSSQTTQHAPSITFRSAAASAAGTVAKTTAEEDEGSASEEEEEDNNIITFDDKNEQQQQRTVTESSQSQSQSQQYDESSEAAKMQQIFKEAAAACELRRKNDEEKELQQRLRQQHEQQTKQQWLGRNLQSLVHKSLLWLLSVSFLKRTAMAVQVKRQNKTEHEQQTDEKQHPWLIQKLLLFVHTLLVLTVSVLERAAAVIEFKRQNEREKQLRQLRQEKLEQLKKANQPWLVKELQLLVHKLLLLPVTSSLPSAWVQLLSPLTWDQTETMISYGHDILQQQQKDDINVEILLLKRIRQVREQKTISTTAT